MPVSPGASGMQPRGTCRPWRGTLASGHKPRCGLLALQSLESNPQLSFATRMEDWTSLGQHKGHPEFPVVIRESCYTSRKTTRSEEHTSELQSPTNLVCRLLLEKKKKEQLFKNSQGDKGRKAGRVWEESVD